MAGDTLKLTPHESVTIVRSEPEVLEVEAVYGAKGSPPPPHLHPEQEEHFEVLEGELTAKVDGEERVISAGETLDIRRRQKHQMWNSSGSGTRVRWQTKPALRTEQWFRAIDRAVREAGGKQPGPLAFAPLLDEYRDVFRLAVGPDAVVGPAMSLLGKIGRARGAKP